MARYERAVSNILEGRTHGRELDEAFENWDGHAMVVALMRAYHRQPAPSCIHDAMDRHLFGQHGPPHDWGALWSAHQFDSWEDIETWARLLRQGKGRQVAEQVPLFA